MYYRETSIYFVDHFMLLYILIFYISAILYLLAGGYKCRLTTFPIRFAYVISSLWYCHCVASLTVLCHEQMNKYHINKWVALTKSRLMWCDGCVCVCVVDCIWHAASATFAFHKVV